MSFFISILNNRRQIVEFFSKYLHNFVETPRTFITTKPTIANSHIYTHHANLQASPFNSIPRITAYYLFQTLTLACPSSSSYKLQ